MKKKLLHFRVTAVVLALILTAWTGKVIAAEVTLPTNSTTFKLEGTNGCVAEKSGIKYTYTKGSTGDMSYVLQNDHLRMYQNSTLAITSTAIIQEVEVKIMKNYDANKLEVSDGTYTTASDKLSGTWTGNATEVVFTASAQVRVSEITVTTSDAEIKVAAPTITGESPFLGSTAITLACETEGASIYYTTDETEPSATNGTLYSGTPFSIEATTTVKAIAVKDADASLVASKTFVARKSVATVAELNKLEKGDVFSFTGDAVVVAKPEGDTRYLYIKDATGGSLIYGGSYEALAEGNHITPNWLGTVDIYGGLFEAIPQSELTAVEGKQDKIAYDIVGLDAITAENVNRIVKIKGVTYTVPDAKKNFKITKGDATVAGYNRFISEMAEPSAVDTYDMVGAISVYATNGTTTYQFMPISIETAPRPIVINAETGADLTALVNAEKEALTTAGVKVGDITINLAENGTYSVSGSIEAPASVVINGNNATVDASALTDAAPFILMSETPSVEEINQYFRVDAIKIANVTIKGLKNSLFYDNKKKYCVVDFTIDNSILALETSAVNYEAVIAFEGGGAKDMNITNSTVYGNNMTAGKYFVRYNNSARLDRYGFNTSSNYMEMNYLNNTFYNLLISGGQWGNYNGLNGYNCAKYNVKNNIWYNCGNEIIRRMAGGRFGGSAVRDFANNTYFYESKDNSKKESSYDNSGTILITDPTFADAANADFHVFAGSQQAKEQTGDPRWFVEYDAAQALPIAITVAPEADAEIAAAVTAAKATVDKVGDITINLVKDAAYTITSSIEAPASVVINGNNATIDAKELAAPLVLMSTTPSVVANDKGFYPINDVVIKDVKVTGLAQQLFYANKVKYVMNNLTCTNSVIQVAGGNKIVFDFNGGGVTGKLDINKSTIYANPQNTGALYSSQSGSKPKDEAGLEKHTISIMNSTLYNIAYGKNVNTLRQNNQTWLEYIVKDNIVLDCGKKEQFIKGLNSGQPGANPTWVVDRNTFLYTVDGVITNTGAKESNGDADEPITNSLVTDPEFKNAAEGDFTVGASTQQAQLKTGDPRWLVEFVAPTDLNKTALETEIATAKTLLGDASTEDGTPGATLKTAITDAETALTTAVFQHEIDAAVAALKAAEEAYKATGIVNIDADANADNGAWYNANGVRVAKPTQKGLYIHNGKKIVIK